ncbi:SCO family protein [Tenacibaculum sp. IB213877]|uniref:SCO family protein n=1 Tax=Tenacibaculum sp. IB213877 TaxID=3097351 RepID=UPI002A5AD4A7|nr:SCO family protein [Tenacibaculum sp. IB213877]MDY0779839.1 SCO family protein [Tenacibaculum sp. IB213877]
MNSLIAFIKKKSTRYRIIILLCISLSIYSIWFFFDSLHKGGDFTLNYNGNEWVYSKESKKINLIYFGFTKCRSVCPVTMSYARLAFKELNAEALDDIQLIFIDVDSENDTPLDAYNYAKMYNPLFIGLIGTQEEIHKTIRLFPVGYLEIKDENSDIGYEIVHTDNIFFLDNKGQILDWVSSPENSEEILLKIKEYL